MDEWISLDEWILLLVAIIKQYYIKQNVVTDINKLIFIYNWNSSFMKN